MKELHFNDYPLKVFGAPLFDSDQPFSRLPDSVAEKINKTAASYSKRCPGARLGFRTNAKEFKIKAKLKTLSLDLGMSVYQCQSFMVLIGDRTKDPVYCGNVVPKDYDDKDFEKVIKNPFDSGEISDVLIFLPRNEVIEDISVVFDDGDIIEPPTPYLPIKPVLYYGSSITEGACASIMNGYNAIISNHLNIDYYNFGFSGSCRGEIELAEFFGTLDISLFVFDYDHNASNAFALETTHEKFFKKFRVLKPDIPVIMMSMPAAVYTEENKKRREVIKNTYLNALSSGDKNVYFIDGEKHYGEVDRNLCSIDGIHPNDLGFYRMAKNVEPVIKKALYPDCIV